MRDGGQVGFPTVGMNRDHLLPSVGAMNFVETFARYLERLCRGGILERERMRSIGLGDVDGGAAFAGRAQFNIGTGGDVGGTILLAAQIAGRFLDERHERCMQRKVVGDVVER